MLAVTAALWKQAERASEYHVNVISPRSVPEPFLAAS
jgi:hypothetical protein